jgi:hypothetical protein
MSLRDLWVGAEMKKKEKKKTTTTSDSINNVNIYTSIRDERAWASNNFSCTHESREELVRDKKTKKRTIKI